MYIYHIAECPLLNFSIKKFEILHQYLFDVIKTIRDMSQMPSLHVYTFCHYIKENTNLQSNAKLLNFTLFFRLTM